MQSNCRYIHSVRLCLRIYIQRRAAHWGIQTRGSPKMECHFASPKLSLNMSESNVPNQGRDHKIGFHFATLVTLLIRHILNISMFMYAKKKLKAKREINW